MKRIVILLALIALWGCGKEQKDSLVGSIWVSNWGSDSNPTLRAIEFTSETSVKSYSTDEYLGESYPQYGNYTREGNSITFSGLNVYYVTPYEATTGTISNDFLVVHFTHYNKTFDITTEHTYRFQRKK